MLKGGSDDGFYDFSDHPYCRINPNGVPGDGIYGSDQFRMYAYKIRRCTRSRSHDWTDCPYAHRGEKAQRRDPRRIPYSAIACPAYRNGRCYKGDSCEFAHGVFEYWLHPARYRTRACTAGKFCQRKVCFFAHTPEQLRAEGNVKCYFTYRARMLQQHDRHHDQYNHNHLRMFGSSNNGLASDSPATSSKMMAIAVMPQYRQFVVSPSSPLSAVKSGGTSSSSSSSVASANGFFDGVSGFVKSVRAMKIRDDKGKNGAVGFEVPAGSDMPDLEWISDLVE